MNSEKTKERNVCKPASKNKYNGVKMTPKEIRLNWLLLVIVIGMMVACTKKPSDQPVQTKQKPSIILDGDDILLAKVNGKPITKFDLDLSIRSTLGPDAVEKLDKDQRKKILESIIMSQAIFQEGEKELSEKDKAMLDRIAKVYRDQMVVKQYLAKHTPPEAVTQEMIQAYYEKNPARFGGKTIRKYEMITSKGDLTGTDRNLLIEALKNPVEKKDWKKWVKELRTKGHPVMLRHGQVNEKVLHAKLIRMMLALKKGETSTLSFIKGQIYLVRITDEKVVKPRPLSEVTARIRKILRPGQLKKSIKKASLQVLKNAEVVYE